MSMKNQDDRLETLKQKYAPVLRTIEQQGVRLQNVHVQDDKLLIRGVASSDEAKNRVWDQIKMVDPTHSDLTADITVEHGAGAGRSVSGHTSAGAAGQQTYTVQSGDSLSKISQQFYGTAQKYMKIFEANRDKLQDPDKIKPGQQLVIPQ